MDKQVFKKVEKLAKEVKQNLRNKGFVVPRDNGDGTITVDKYTIVKESTGFYTIRDQHNDIIVDRINLAQTAAVLANNLALRRWIDQDIVDKDRIYGYNLFEETVTKQHIDSSRKRDDHDRADVLNIKLNIAQQRKRTAYSAILSSFDKLRRL
jgi:hypothetical protein